jgi:hypothetical protein
MTKHDEDAHIDVCMGCGRYYGYTQSLVDLWYASRLHNDKQVMPQLCYSCMKKEYDYD